MNQKALLDNLVKLCEPAAAPFNEIETRTALHQWLLQSGLSFQTDPFGNTLVRLRRGMPRSKIVFVANLDHPALRVSAVQGTKITCVAEGDLPITGIKGAKVVFPQKLGENISGRILSAKIIENGGGKKIHSVVVLPNGKKALPKVDDFAVFDLPGYVKKGSRLKLRAADDLVGAACIVAALSDLSKRDVPMEAWGVFTRAQELGFYGSAALAISNLIPKDLPIVSVECSKAYGGIELGEGPVVRSGDKFGPFDPRTVALIGGAAKTLAEKKFKYQNAMMAEGTCEAAAFGAFGYRAGGIAIPLANYRNQGAKGVTAEEVDLRDVEGAVELIKAVAERQGAGIDDIDLFRNELLRNSEDGRVKLRGGDPNAFPED